MVAAEEGVSATVRRSILAAGTFKQEAQQEEFKPIPPSGRERDAAIRANVRHASAVRAQLRVVLWEAAVAGKLKHGLNAQLEHLGNKAAEGIDVDPDDAVGDGANSEDDSFEMLT